MSELRLIVAQQVEPPLAHENYREVMRQVQVEKERLESKLIHEGDRVEYSGACDSAIIATQVRSRTEDRLITIAGSGPHHLLAALCEADNLIGLADWDKRYRCAQLLNVCFAHDKCDEKDIVSVARVRKALAEIKREVPLPAHEEEAEACIDGLEWFKQHTKQCGCVSKVCWACVFIKTYIWMRDVQFFETAIETAYACRTVIPKQRKELLHDYDQLLRSLLGALVLAFYASVELQADAEAFGASERLIDQIYARFDAHLKQAAMLYYYMRQPPPGMCDRLCNASPVEIAQYLGPLGAKLRAELEKGPSTSFDSLLLEALSIV